MIVRDGIGSLCEGQNAIGAEHSDPELRPFSLIAASYFDGRSNGTVGIIGPTRMRYSKAITAVDIAAIAVARVLRDVN